jgi:hypothetical protein
MAVSPAVLEQFRGVLVRQAGGYMYNVVRESRATCAVCSTPCPGYMYCQTCNRHRGAPGQRADQVASLTYAVAGEQSGWVMRNYKATPAVVESRNVVAMLGLLGVGLHSRCAGARVGVEVTHWASIPSLPAKPGIHPLRPLVASAAPGIEIGLVAAAATDDRRAVRQEHFLASAMPDGAHLLLIDDTWASGGHAQSAVLAGRAAGAAVVSVLTLARWIEPGWKVQEYGSSEGFLRARCTSDYDPTRCPWTGGICP